jgi:hypothetical protein
MRKVILGLAVLVLIFGLGSTRLNAQTVVTFDDLPGSGLVPNGYGGINWNSNWNYYGTAQPPYNPESSPNRVYTFNANASFNFLTPQVFDGAYFSGFATAPVTFELYDGSTLVFTSATLAPDGTPTFLSSGYSGLVTEVIVSSPSPDFYVMDNVTYGGPVSATPEPGSFLLFGTGLLASFILVFRKWAR